MIETRRCRPAPICMIVGNPGSMRPLNVWPNTRRAIARLETVAFVGGEPERPFGQARLAQRLRKKLQVLGVAKMRPNDLDRRNGRYNSEEMNAFRHGCASIGDATAAGVGRGKRDIGY